jgi:hypothetical protein
LLVFQLNATDFIENKGIIFLKSLRAFEIQQSDLKVVNFGVLDSKEQVEEVNLGEHSDSLPKDIHCLVGLF